MNHQLMYITRSRLNLVCALALGCILIAGCSNKPPEFRGTVTWNGKPIPQGYVEFSPLDGEGQIVGTQIVDGAFTMRCAPGPKKISVRANRQVGLKPANERMPEEPIMHQYLPGKFNSNTELSKELDVSEPEFNLVLEGEELEYREQKLPSGRKDDY